MREIVTIQLGQQSNYLGTHFWNVQESYFTYGQEEESLVDHDVHFRPGLGADRSETFLPRTLIYDLKSGFGSMRQTNALYELPADTNSSSLWNGQAVMQKQQLVEPSIYRESLDAGLAPPELDTNSVRYWSDFSRVFFHPKSVVQLNEHELSSTTRPFEKWRTGEQLFSSLEKEYDILDHDLRPFVEEADQMQGIQIMTSVDDAWGSFAAKYLDRISDEYGKTPTWVWGMQRPVSGLGRDDRLSGIVNKAQAFVELVDQASLVVPMGAPQKELPYSVALDQNSPWHVSALFAAAFESTTLCTRLRRRDHVFWSDLRDMADLLNVSGKQKIANIALDSDEGLGTHLDGPDLAQASVEGRHQQGHNFTYEDDLGNISSQNEADFLDINLSSPDGTVSQANHAVVHSKPHIFCQLGVSRGGVPATPRQTRARENRIMDHDDYFSRHSSVHWYKSALPFPILDSYPSIFRHRNGHPVTSQLSMRSTLSTTSSVAHDVENLRQIVSRSIDLEDREMVSNRLAEIADGYKEGWSSDSDDYDD